MANVQDDVVVVARQRLAGERRDDSPRLLPGAALCLPPFPVLDIFPSDLVENVHQIS
jgi:hypothetical protein